MAPELLPEPIAVANVVARSLTRLGISYVIGGSFASSVHGEPRSTNDVDMVTDMHQRHIDAFIGALGVQCYVSHDAVAEAVRTGGAFNVIYIPTAVKVDVFVAGLDAFDHERLQRRIPVSFSSESEQITLFIDTAENTILRAPAAYWPEFHPA
jgi:hypothetical protein